MFRALYYSQENHLATDLSLMDVAFALQDAAGLLWVDFDGSHLEDEEQIYQKTFGFHHLAIEDALRQSHVSKVDDWGQYLYLVLHSADYQDGSLQTMELDIFLGKNYVVTHHEGQLLALDAVWEAVSRDERHLKEGADHILYRLADEVVDGFTPVVEALDQEINRLEEEIFSRPVKGILERIFTLKRSVLHLRRILGPQREVLNRLARESYSVVDTKDRIYFKDVYDHLVRLYDLSENIRDLVSGTLDTYLSVVNNRMNEVMKTLTVITTLFMPLTFVAGFFGMNFFFPDMPVTAFMHRPVFYMVLLLMSLLPVGMFTWMHRRGWM